MSLFEWLVLVGLLMIFGGLYAIGKGMDEIADLLRQIRNRLDRD